MKEQTCTGVLLVLLTLLSLLFLSFPTARVAAVSEKNITLEEGETYAKIVVGASGDEFDIDFTVTQGAKVDLYIMTSAEYDSYKWGGDFIAVLSREHTRSVNEKWTQPDDQSYRLVVDNADNGHDSDAQPQGSVIFNLKFEREQDDEGFFKDVRRDVGRLDVRVAGIGGGKLLPYVLGQEVFHRRSARVLGQVGAARPAGEAESGDGHEDQCAHGDLLVSP